MFQLNFVDTCVTNLNWNGAMVNLHLRCFHCDRVILKTKKVIDDVSRNRPGWQWLRSDSNQSSNQPVARWQDDQTEVNETKKAGWEFMWLCVFLKWGWKFMMKLFRYWCFTTYWCCSILRWTFKSGPSIGSRPYSSLMTYENFKTM